MTRRFLMHAHTGRPDALNALLTVITAVSGHGVRPVLSERLARDLAASDPAWLGRPVPTLDELTALGVIVEPLKHAIKNLELVMVFGGDGTILRAVEAVRESGTPVHGVNLGHVGFLAESEPEDLDDTVHRLVRGEYDVEERTTLAIDILDNGEVVATDWALNEAVVEKVDRAKMINVEVEIDGRPVTAFGCDGLIFSTPTGSTAYAFSAGGPVIWPEVEAVMILPLAAHALFARPLVYGPSSSAAVTLAPSERAVVSCDGRRTIDIRPGMVVRARTNARNVRLARLHAKPFTDRLVSKFHLPVEGWRDRDSTRDRAEGAGA
ncbi:NAD kinase [Micrococcales bacterium 31B]|nr:NAD kinase [Micrococcales bacterium 31B]